MQKHVFESFEKMNRLSSRGIPFFFFVDFEMKGVEIFEMENLAHSGIKIDFPTFKNVSVSEKSAPSFSWDFDLISREGYAKGFTMVQDEIKKGNSYLANYTQRTEIFTDLTLENIFQYSKAKYKVFYPNRFVFFSPETFVEIKNQMIYTYPMKGTIDASIESAQELLKNDKKEKAEHYTVVDLLRNDLSMVADFVEVLDFQHIDLIKTHQKNLYAMSSKIKGDLKPEMKNQIGTILKTLLPAGSILGAPKIKTMEIILLAENYNRGYYTGVCGFFDGKNLDSCVMIRFIEQKEGKLFFKSGGGVTHMSDLESEYQEMKNKIYVPIY